MRVQSIADAVGEYAEVWLASSEKGRDRTELDDRGRENIKERTVFIAVSHEGTLRGNGEGLDRKCTKRLDGITNVVGDGLAIEVHLGTHVCPGFVMQDLMYLHANEGEMREPGKIDWIIGCTEAKGETGETGM